MNTSEHIAKHLSEVHFGGNWTTVNLKDTLADVTWEEATTQVYDLNTIATLVFHINYYISAVTMVLQGEVLTANDKFSFDLPPITSQQEWEDLKKKALSDAETFTYLIAILPETRLWEPFTDEKYGIYYRNLHGIIEHTHYHLGQITLIKKIVLAAKKIG